MARPCHINIQSGNPTQVLGYKGRILTEENMKIREDEIDQLLQARSEIDEELRRQKTKQTVLFTDIVGSTTYFDRFGDTEGLLLLYRHDALVKGTVEEYRGVVVKTIGDSVMAEFADPLAAVHAAIAIQRLLLHHNQSLARNERLQIRIGIHTGFGFKRANDFLAISSTSPPESRNAAGLHRFSFRIP